MSCQTARPLQTVIVGAGHRSLEYAAYAKSHPEAMQIVGVADPNAFRRRQVAQTYGLREPQCFATAAELARAPRFADAAINGTMDELHVPTSLSLIDAGYDILLEKPFATSEEEMARLVQAARGRGRRIMICHVLRYTPFYAAIRQLVAEGRIGTVVNIQTVEHVSYHHMAVAFVRGKWNRRERTGSSMLLSKCCHDLDLVAWMKSGVAPRSVASFGSNRQFRPANAPPSAGTRCLADCPIEPQCDYSARKHYVDIANPLRWSAYTWAGLDHPVSQLPAEEQAAIRAANPTMPAALLENLPLPAREEQIRSLESDNPHGRCVWRCDNDVVDHQSVVIEFADGATATHNMVGGTSRPMRSIHLLGTQGEIQGVFDDSRFVIRHPDPRRGHEYSEETVDLNVRGDMSGALGNHGGGDDRLVADFVRLLRGEAPSLSCTRLEDSVNGHRMVFAADRAMEERRVIELPGER